MKGKNNNILNGPTLLTILRIVLTVPLMFCIFIDTLPTRTVTLICFIVASVTDFIDGKWARKTKRVTELGMFLDPLADKMLVNLTFLALVVLGLVPVWMFTIILVRDFAVDGMRMMQAKNGKVVAASFYGKAKTMTQMFTLALILLNLILKYEPLNIVNTVLLYIVLILTILSGVDYLRKGWKQLIK